jgi:hypothetical protein
VAKILTLRGPRKESRPGEKIALRPGWLMPERIKPIEASDVARALVALAKRDTPGVRVVESRELKEIAASRSPVA